MKLKSLLFLILSLNISLLANNSLSVMTYNLENFFDTYDDPGKDDKAYLPLSDKQDQSHIDACNNIKVSKWKNECLYLDWNEENKNKKLAGKLFFFFPSYLRMNTILLILYYNML